MIIWRDRFQFECLPAYNLRNSHIHPFSSSLSMFFAIRFSSIGTVPLYRLKSTLLEGG